MSEKREPPTSVEIDRRLRIVAELRNLCLSLGRARKVEEEQPGGRDGIEAPLPENPPAKSTR